MAENTLIQDQLKKLQRRKEILIILLFLFVIIVFWIGLSLFSSQQKLGITPEQKKLAQPLTPNIDVNTLQKLEFKQKYSEYELQEFPIYILYQDGGGTRKIDIMEGLPVQEEIKVATAEIQAVQEIDEIISETEE